VIREKEIESYLTNQVRKAGGKVYKFVSPGASGVPDRIVVFEWPWITFVELKAPKKSPEYLQTFQHKILKKLGYRVEVIDTKDGVNRLVNDYKKKQ